MNVILPRYLQKNLAAKGAIFALLAFLFGLLNAQIFEVLKVILLFILQTTTAFIVYFVLLIMMGTTGGGIFMGLISVTAPIALIAIAMFAPRKQDDQ